MRILLRIAVTTAILASMVIAPAGLIKADTSADISVVAYGFIISAPNDFTVTYVTDYEVGLSWTKPGGADGTMVRAAFGRLPEDIDDGYLVYEGDLEYATDWVALDTIDGKVYYRAFTELGGIYEGIGASGFIEGIGLQLIAFIVLCLGLTIGGFVLRRGLLVFSGVAAWGVLAIYCFTKTGYVWGTFDVYLGVGWLSIGMVIGTALEAGYMLSRGQEEAIEKLDEKKTSNELLLDEMELENERLKARRRG